MQCIVVGVHMSHLGHRSTWTLTISCKPRSCVTDPGDDPDAAAILDLVAEYTAKQLAIKLQHNETQASFDVHMRSTSECAGYNDPAGNLWPASNIIPVHIGLFISIRRSYQ